MSPPIEPDNTATANHIAKATTNKSLHLTPFKYKYPAIAIKFATNANSDISPLQLTSANPTEAAEKMNAAKLSQL